MWNVLTSEKNKLEDKVQQKDKLIQREKEKTQVRTYAYIACQGTLMLKEKELKSCKAQCDALQAGHHQELSQVEETCRRKLEVLHEENAALNETVNRLTTVKAKSEDEVQQKDKLIQRETEKMQTRTNTYIAFRGTLKLKEKELKSCKAQCDALQACHHQELSQVEETCRKKLEVLHEENAALTETVNRLTTVNAKSEDEVQQKDKLIQREKEKTQVRTNTYIACRGTLKLKEKELKSCKAKCDALQASHHQELSQVEETCRKNLEVLHEENAALTETVNRLTTLKANSEDEVQKRDEHIQRETEKMRARFNAYIACLGTLTVKEKELKSCTPSVMHCRHVTTWR
ncbi:unnamed protein product [Pleuronectes platessa]|uniref:Uncharacterized protein n=1 Tax=Pleuronectes platessa TaxID=8262 RepID=A0A9N7US50_PLEPL|nr:unnamed protein product [Pleuronectes platessa]